MINTDIEKTRTLSKLTNRPHIFELENKRLVAFGGVVLPLCSFSMMFMWALAGSNFYHSIFQEQPELVQECFDLNADLFRAKQHKGHIGAVISNRFREVLAELNQIELEELVDHMFDEIEVE